MTGYASYGNSNLSYMMGDCHICQEAPMGLAATEKELAGKAARFLKAEMKRAGMTYAQLAERLKEHGLEETEASITSKLARGTFAATFMLSVMAALEMEGMSLEQL